MKHYDWFRHSNILTNTARCVLQDGSLGRILLYLIPKKNWTISRSMMRKEPILPKRSCNRCLSVITLISQPLLDKSFFKSNFKKSTFESEGPVNTGDFYSEGAILFHLYNVKECGYCDERNIYNLSTL